MWEVVLELMDTYTTHIFHVNLISVLLQLEKISSLKLQVVLVNRYVGPAGKNLFPPYSTRFRYMPVFLNHELISESFKMSYM